ncbi:BON domain-containing protein [Caldimonas sp. KR1-144]|uniref:BON domain-containing protein n=1 Tax=Caldimonas sp. KR1-144 TaxID=3400911 RepID=UPI003C06C609
MARMTSKRSSAAVHLVLALAAAGSAALLASGCAVSSGQSSVGQYVDDTTITTRVKTRMAADPTVSAMRIQVETLNGVVQLAGFAASERERQLAGDIARNVPDVKSVRNDIVVRPATQ